MKIDDFLTMYCVNITQYMSVSFYGSPQKLEDIPEKCRMRAEILHLHQAITKYNVWSFVAEEPPKGCGFMYAQRDWQDKCENDPLVIQDGHSGASLGNTWRVCQVIARVGWVEFCKLYSK